jgi:DNA modification methylase
LTGLPSKNLVGIPWRVALALQDDGWYLRQDIIWHKPNPMPESCRDRCTKAHEYLFLLSKSARYHYDQDAIRENKVYDGNDTGVGFGHGTDKDKRSRERIKTPAGWDTGTGAHGNFHKAGRGQTRYTFARKTATQGVPGAPDQHREDREPKFYQGTRNKRSVWTVATHPYKGAHFATFPPKLIEPCILAGCPRGGTILDPFGGSGTTAFVANAYGRKAILCELNPANVPLIRERLGIGYETQPAETEMDLFKQVV